MKNANDSHMFLLKLKVAKFFRVSVKHDESTWRSSLCELAISSTFRSGPVIFYRFSLNLSFLRYDKLIKNLAW